jgi:hypothetical protein
MLRTLPESVKQAVIFMVLHLARPRKIWHNPHLGEIAVATPNEVVAGEVAERLKATVC